MSNKKNKVSQGLKELLNGKKNTHISVFAPVSFEEKEKRESYIESFSHALVMDLASSSR